MIREMRLMRETAVENEQAGPSRKSDRAVAGQTPGQELRRE
jgi:hypothetical protein